MRGISVLLVALIALTSMPVAVAPAVGVLNFSTHVGDTDISCGDNTAYKLLRYKWASTPIPVWFDDAKIPDAFESTVRDGMAPWEAEEHPAGDLATIVLSAPANGITVTWGPIDGPAGTLAVTSISYYVRSKNIAEVTMTFDSAENWAIMAAACGIPFGSGVSVLDVAVHEFGHALVSLDHASGDALTMHAIYRGGLERTLATGDRLGIEARFGGGGDGGGGNGGGPPQCHPVRGC